MRFFISSVGLLLLSASIIGCSQSTETATAPAAKDAVKATTVSFANAKCPIMGGKPSTDLIAVYDGKTIGFCCDGCPEKWSALSDEVKAEHFAKAK